MYAEMWIIEALDNGYEILEYSLPTQASERVDMIKKFTNIVLKVPNDADVIVEGVLGVLVLHVAHTVALHPL